MTVYFVNPEEAKQYSHGSKKSILTKCPVCGRIRKKPIAIKTLYRTHSIGCPCGDGISYPNKFMFAVSEQLSALGEIRSFTREYRPSWAEGRKYDFLIELKTENHIIVEMDGDFHSEKSRDKSVTIEKQKEIDKKKDRMALEHGLSVIRIPATVHDNIKENILCKLSGLLNLDEVNWNEVYSFAHSDLVKTVCIYYSECQPLSIKELAGIFHISESTALTYVKKGEKIRLCVYNEELQKFNKYYRAREEHLERLKRVIRVCLYYVIHAPILASDIAKRFNIEASTVRSYLKEGEKYGFPPYDLNYSKMKNRNQIKSIIGHEKKREVLVFSLEEKLLERFESAAAAARNYGIYYGTVHGCCCKKRKSHRYLFRFADDCEIDYDNATIIQK